MAKKNILIVKKINNLLDDMKANDMESEGFSRNQIMNLGMFKLFITDMNHVREINGDFK